jgi:hypothetical protein
MNVILQLLCCLAILRVSSFAQANTPVAKLIDFQNHPISGDLSAVVQTNIDTATAEINSVSNAQALINAFFHAASISIPTKDFGCIIHVIKWATPINGGSQLIVAKSNWYAYNSHDWVNSDLKSTKRLYGVSRPYVLAIHLDVPVAPVTNATYSFAYTYKVTHRLPANVQDLTSAISLFGNATIANRAEATPLSYWALGAVEGNPPSDITLAGAVTTANNTRFNLDTSEVKFDNEGFYRWDISVGIPVVSYKRLQDVATNAGQETLANVDKRDILVLGNVFFKPVDLNSTNFLGNFHFVGGVKVGSRPLYASMAGIGWGPAIANFYAGVMILTTKLPNHTRTQNYKFTFGINVPLRAVAGKLGLKTQM